jgi:hypothetical protein
MVRQQVVDTPDMDPGNQQQMDRCCRFDILEHHIGVVFIQKMAFNFFVDNSAEKAVFGHYILLGWKFYVLSDR